MTTQSLSSHTPTLIPLLAFHSSNNSNVGYLFSVPPIRPASGSRYPTRRLLGGRPGRHLSVDAEGAEGGREVGQVVGALGDVGPADLAAALLGIGGVLDGGDGEGARRLPAGAALAGAVPDVLRLAELEGLVEHARVQDVPGRGHPQAPLRVQLTLVIDDDLDVPVAADLDHPPLRRLGARVRDGDEVDVLVLRGQVGQGLEDFLGD